MEVQLVVSKDADMSVVLKEYPDLYIDDDSEPERGIVYWIGQSTDEDKDSADGEWLTYDDAVAFCGFCEGAVKGVDALIEGNGPWAQGKVRETPAYQQAFERGELIADTPICDCEECVYALYAQSGDTVCCYYGPEEADPDGRCLVFEQKGDDDEQQ